MQRKRSLQLNGSNETRKGRQIRTPRGPSGISAIESLESRSLPSATGFEALNQGIFGHNAAGEWVSLRYDGESYVQESAADLNSVGRNLDPIAADFDGDGRAEHYVRNSLTGDWYSIQPENNQNALRWVSRWTVTSRVIATVVCDLNGDGREEIAALNQDGNWHTLSWNGTSFVTTFLVGWYRSEGWTGVNAVDLDGNGADEIVAFDSSARQWFAVSANQNRYETLRLGDWNSTSSYSSFLTADMDGDGRGEIIARDASGNWYRLARSGAGYQTAFLTNWGVGGNWREFAIADLNGDGKDEIIGQEMTTGSWWNISQQGSTYASRWMANANANVSFEFMLTGDVTGDGRADIVSRDGHGNFWVLSVQETTPQLRSVKNWSRGVEWRDIVLTDYDSDGAREIIGRNAETGVWWGINAVAGGYGNEFLASWGTAADYLYVFAGPQTSARTTGLIAWDSSGNWWSSTLGEASANTKLANLEPHFRFTHTYFADINGDGSPDLLAFDSHRGNWWGIVHDLQGTSLNFLGRWNRRVDWKNTLFADLDGDGRQDLVARDSISGEWWAILSPGGVFRSQVITVWNPSSFYRNIMVLDLDGDGRDEIVGRNETGGWWAVKSEGGAFRNQFLQGWNEDWDWMNIGVVDLEGDGRQEIIGHSNLKGEWWLLASNVNGNPFGSRKIASWTASDVYTDLLIGDINGDGREDVITRNTRGAWWMISFAGGTSYATGFLVGWNNPSDWRNFLVADLNGDGKAEVIGQNSQTLDWWGIFGKDSGYESRLLIPGTESLKVDRFRAVDMDHDGAWELVGFDGGKQTWWSFALSGTTSVVRDLGAAPLQQATVGAIPGVSDAAFKQWLLKTVPSLKANLATNRLAAARQLMNWAAQNADSAISASLETRTTTRMTALSRPSDLYHDFFEQSVGGVYCGGFSIFLSNMLKLFGYEAFTLNFGELRDDLTHVNVIVAIPNGSNDWNYYILDPTFNITFLEPGTSRMLTFQEMIQKINSGQAHQISVRQDSIAERDWLAFGTVSLPQYELKLQTQSAEQGIRVYSRASFTLSAWLLENRVALTRYGYSTGTTGYLQLLTNQIFSVGPTTNSAVRDRFISIVRSLGIRM